MNPSTKAAVKALFATFITFAAILLLMYFIQKYPKQTMHVVGIFLTMCMVFAVFVLFYIIFRRR